MNDTPETDAETMQDEMDHVDSDIGPFAPSNTVCADFARKLERERDEAIDKYQSLQKTFEEWQLKFLSEQAELLHNKDVERDKLFDEAYQIRIERDEARSKLSLNQQTLTIAEGTLSDLRKQRDGWSAMCSRYKQERDEAREMQTELGMWRDGNILHEVHRNELQKAERERDEAREKLDEEMKWHHRTHTELVQTQCKILDMQMGRDEIQEKYDNLATEHMLVVNKLCEERDEARAEIQRLRLDAQREAENHDRMVKELESLYDKLKS
jgi:hypothetical protein